jgi:ribonuclease Z
MAFSVTVLGSGSALPTSNRNLTAHVLNADERFFLIDCGEGTQYQLRKYKAKFSRLDHIFITHLHGDHLFGLPGLISTFNLLGRKKDLHIYAHQNIKPILNQFLSYFFDKLTYNLVYHPINVNEYSLLFEDEKITIHSFPLCHRIDANGFVFREKPRLRNIRKELIEFYRIPVAKIYEIKKGADFITEDGSVIANKVLTYEAMPTKSYAFCSDTAYTENVIPYISGIDLLYHEATFADEDISLATETGHSTASQAATIALKANVKKLIIGHFSARYKNIDPLLESSRKIFPATEAAEDGRQFVL